MIWIWYIGWSVLMLVVFFIGLRLFMRPKLNYDYYDMAEYNKTAEKSERLPLPSKNELSVLLDTIANNDNDEAVLRVLFEVYEPLVDIQDGLDVLILTLSDLLRDRAITAPSKEEAAKTHRASRITKRLAHNLYRRYRIKNPKYSNSKFLQFVD